jgi:mannitol-1-/sugar-/sorbitol-6-phosphatase
MKRFDCSAVVFDLDGVLVDSTAYVEQQWRRWATSRGLRPEPFLRVCHGRRALETIRMAAPHLDAEAEVRAFVPLDEESASEPLGPLPGALRLLTALPAGSWAVATSGSRPVATTRLRRAGLPIPPVLVCAEDVTRGKPSPDAYLLAARSLGCPPEQVLVVEDAPAGIQAARTAGMAIVGLTTTHSAFMLDADACAASLVGVHLGRVNRAADGRDRIELLVVEV